MQDETSQKPEGFENAQNKAQEFVKDKEKTGHLLDEALRKAERNKNVLENIWVDLQALMRLTKAWLKNEYTQTPWQTIVFAIAGIIYFVNPFDIVPDFIPGAGYLDDATVIGFVIKSIRREIKKFLDWEKAQSSTPEET